MQRLLALMLLLGGCSKSDQSASLPPQAVTIAGLYERIGAGVAKDAICFTGEGKSERFGLAIRGGSSTSCTAKGSVSRQGESIALLIDGAPDCDLRVTATGAGIDLAPPRGAECSYYCGAGATLTGGPFVVAARGGNSGAVDLVGEPLC